MHRSIHLIHFSIEDFHLHHACDIVVRDVNCYAAFVTCNKRKEKSETSGTCSDRGEESNRGQSFDSSPVLPTSSLLCILFPSVFTNSTTNLLITMAAQRVSQIVSQLNPLASPVDKITQKNPDDVVITLAIRTPLTKAGRGAMKDTGLDEMVFKLLEQVNARSNLDPKHVEDICLGNVREGSAAYYVRAAALAAGFPHTCAASASARFCSSGLTATQHIATSIQTGIIECGIAVGAELLSDNRPRLERPFADEIMANAEAKDCMIPMGGMDG